MVEDFARLDSKSISSVQEFVYKYGQCERTSFSKSSTLSGEFDPSLRELCVNVRTYLQVVVLIAQVP